MSEGSPFIEQLETDGWAIAPAAVGGELLDDLARELERALVYRQEIRRRNRVDGNNDGTLHHLVADHPCFILLLRELERFEPLLRAYFAGNFILNSYGGVINQRGTTAYVHGVHRDIRFSSDVKRFMLNLLVMLDDFTLENGATHLLSGSQTMAQKPATDVFLRDSARAIGPRGSFLFFDSRLWHATGQSTVDQPRRALTLTFTSPFFKQQLDYPRLVGYEKKDLLSPFLRQVIGFNARVPATLEEYYVATADRFYQRGQDD
ncbi:MAG TPA: phytanoyl-CoA dioxygenase family protein [Polyangiaceae bacterium]|nr:phytanoyl-CoA dioxygenase family protein [Polyangiaceae bacterium]